MKIKLLLDEDVSLQKDCNLCQEVALNVGQKTNYGSVIIYKTGNSLQEDWFATISPKTGGNPEEDFTIQLMPLAHLTHFSQLSAYPQLAKNYGIAFSRLSAALTELMAEKEFYPRAETREFSTSVATYGKCTTWKDKKEHLHLKIFPFRNAIGQPYTVDSTFEKKEVHKNQKTGEEFVQMKPVHKVFIPPERFEHLSKKLIELLK